MPSLQHIPDPPSKLMDNDRNNKYERLKLLGKGGFAKCYEVRDVRTGQVLACKAVSKQLLVKKDQKEKMTSEICIHRAMNHPNIVKFHSHFEDESFVYVVLEICRNKSLLELHKRRRCLLDPEARYYFYQLVCGCVYLHQNNIIHRDLKLGNLFLDDDLRLKIGDFGLAAQISTVDERKKTLCGTPNYIAPEILLKIGHSFEVDIWSLGCILYTLYVGTPPFETSTLQETYRKIKHNDFVIPGKVPRPAAELIVKCLQKDPTKRPKIHDIMGDPYFSAGLLPTMLPRSSLSMQPRFKTSDVYEHQENKLREPWKPTPQPVVVAAAAYEKNNPVKKADHRPSGLQQQQQFIQFMNTVANSAAIVDNCDRGVKVTVAGFKSNKAVTLKWFPAVPIFFNKPRMQLRHLHALHVQDNKVTSFDEDDENAVRNVDDDNEDIRMTLKSFNESRDFDHGGKGDCLLDSFLKQLSDMLLQVTNNNKTTGGPTMDDMLEAEDPRCMPLYWVTKWVDYSEKYGFGYELSDNSVGVFFNDATQLVTFNIHSNSCCFINDEGLELVVDAKSSGRADIDKKLAVFQNFYQYMEANLMTTGLDMKQKLDCSLARIPYVRMWARNDDVIIFQLVCGVIQANFFSDHSKLIMCPKMEAITFIDSKKVFHTYPISTILSVGLSTDIVDRVTYVRNLLRKITSFSSEK